MVVHVAKWRRFVPDEVEERAVTKSKHDIRKALHLAVVFCVSFEILQLFFAIEETIPVVRINAA